MKLTPPQATPLKGLGPVAAYTPFNRQCPKCFNWLILAPDKMHLLCGENTCTGGPLYGIEKHRPVKE